MDPEEKSMKKLALTTLAAALASTLAVTLMLVPGEPADARPSLPPGSNNVCWQAELTADTDGNGTYDRGVNWLAGNSLAECLPVLEDLEEHAEESEWDYFDEGCATYLTNLDPCPFDF